jgi:hypothetical protein
MGTPDRGTRPGGFGQGLMAGGTGQGRVGGGKEEGEERGREGELTSWLDDRWQPLTGIPPRARGGGREGEGSCCMGKENEREREGWGAHGGRTAPGARLGRGSGRQPTARSRLPLTEFKSRIKNRNKTNARLDTTSYKRNMLRHDAITMST